jgi:hypothetical protein
VEVSNAWTDYDASGYLKPLEEYKDTVVRLFPDLPSSYVDEWSISDIDALVLGLFLECYPRRVAVLDVGTFVGVSAFHFAAHPKVTRVISVDPNPTIAQEINDKAEVTGFTTNSKPLRELRVLDVARAALAKFDDEQRKVALRVGTIGSDQINVHEDRPDGLEKVEVPAPDPEDGTPLLAFVDGLHTRAGVEADLKAIFGSNAGTIAILHDCRRTWGPFVQAGVVSFMEATPREYHFLLFGDLGPSLATSNLGIVYPGENAPETERALAVFGEMFSQRLDPLRLLRREEELVGALNQLNLELEQARAERKRLSERNSHLEELNSRLTQQAPP